ncbi:hypothetical protein H0H92_008682, partial [Tricholoma furcatifolium]
MWLPLPLSFTLLISLSVAVLGNLNDVNPPARSLRPELKSTVIVAGQQGRGRTAKVGKVFSGPPKKKISRAKRMEEILANAASTDSTKVIHLENKNQRKIEWYEIVVATNQKTATKAKKEFRALVDAMNDEVAYARKLIALIEKYTSININVGTLQHWQDAKKAFDKQKALAASQAAAQPASGATSSTLRAILPA